MAKWRMSEWRILEGLTKCQIMEGYIKGGQLRDQYSGGESSGKRGNTIFLYFRKYEMRCTAKFYAW